MHAALQLVVRVGRGLWGSLRRMGYLVAMAGTIALISLTVSLPVWYFASRHRRLYTVLVLTGAAVALLVLLARRVSRAVRASGGFGGFLRSSVLPILKAVALSVGSLGVLYAAVLLASLGRIGPAVIAAAAWILVLGLLKYGRKDRL